RGNQSPAFLITHQRRANSIFVIDEWMTEAALDAEKLTVMPVHVSITRDDPHQIISARAQRHLATIRTIGARGNRLRQFPWPMLMTISSIKQRSGGTDLDAVAALRTIQPAAERADHRIG